MGKFLYRDLRNSGIRQMIANASADAHKDYLKKMGFVEKNGLYQNAVIYRHPLFA